MTGVGPLSRNGKMNSNDDKIEKKALEKHKRFSRLLKNNRLLFELERKKEIEKLIENSPPELQEKLKTLQEDWDRRMSGAKYENNRLVFAREMLMKHLYQKLKPQLSKLSEKLKT